VATGRHLHRLIVSADLPVPFNLDSKFPSCGNARERAAHVAIDPKKRLFKGRVDRLPRIELLRRRLLLPARRWDRCPGGERRHAAVSGPVRAGTPLLRRRLVARFATTLPAPRVFIGPAIHARNLHL